MSSISYANIAANGSSSSTTSASNSNGNSNAGTTVTSPAPIPAEIESLAKSEGQVELPLEETSDAGAVEAPENDAAPKTKEKKLAPAPVPATSVWGTHAGAVSGSTSHVTNVDEYKWPTPEEQQANASAKSSNKNQKFIKPITNKWVPINAKVILPNARTQVTQQASNNGNKKNKKNNNTNNNNNKNNRNKKSAPAVNVGVNGGKPQQKRAESSDASARNSEKVNDRKSEDEEIKSLADDLNGSLTLGSPEVPSIPISTPDESVHQPPVNRTVESSSQESYSPGPQYYQNNGSFVPPNSMNNGQPQHQQQHYNQNRQYNKMNYRNINRFSLPNGGSYNPNFMPFAAPQPYPHPSLPNNYYYQTAYNLPPGQPQGYPQPFAQQPYPIPPVSIPPPISPKQDPINALTQQVDYYFSLENLIKDIYLRKKFAKETGFINVSDILSFKRVQIILNQIKNLNLNEDYNKVVIGAINNCNNIDIQSSNAAEEYDLNKVEIRVKENPKQWILD